MKIKPKIITPKRLLVLFQNLLNDTGLTTSFVQPPFTAEEESEAKYLASEVLKNLEQRGDDRVKASRVRALAVVYLFQMQMAGVINHLAKTLAEIKAGRHQPQPVVDEETPLTAEQIEQANEILGVEPPQQEVMEVVAPLEVAPCE